MTTHFWLWFWMTGFLPMGTCAVNPLGSTPVNELIRRKVEQVKLDSILIQGERIRTRENLFYFYARRGFDPAWSHQDQRYLVIQTLGQADQEGLTPTDYHIQSIERLAALLSPTEEEMTDLDILLTDGILLYASHLLSGKVDPNTIHAQWNINLREGDPVKAIENGLYTNQLAKALSQLPPRQNEYRQLKEALEKYNGMYLLEGDWPIIPDGPTIKPGMIDLRLPDIRIRLHRTENYNPDSISMQSIVYDPELVEVVQRFQHRHGLTADGAIGKSTLEVMNVSLQDRINQIKVNLERWRWLPGQFGSYFLLVNIANFEVQGFRNGKQEVSHKVIVGKPFRKTPVFSATLQYLVFNPTWTLPPTILKEDILPGVRKDYHFLATKGLNVYDNQGNLLDPATIDWSAKAVEWYKYQQEPGPSNALGVVKFMFPNKHDVYMHDTPSRELFVKDQRMFSSGCIRVSEPIDLAMWLLEDTTQWNRPVIDSIITTRKPTTVLLPSRPEVFILYFTCWIDQNGLVQFRKDVYDRDMPIFEALTESSAKP